MTSEHGGEHGGEKLALSGTEYDRQWGLLSDFIRYNPGARHRRRLLTRLVRAGQAPGTVLDVGCGLGELVEMLHDLYPTAAITGVDISEHALDANSTRFPFASFGLLDVERDRLDRQFDLVISSEVIEHLDEQAEAVSNLCAMVAPGGALVVSVPAGKVFATEKSFGHVRHPELGWLEGAVGRAGLTVTDAFRWGFPTYLALKYVVNARPEMTMREFGSGTYSPFKRRLNDAIYLGTFACVKESSKGCQTFLRAVRPAPAP